MKDKNGEIPQGFSPKKDNEKIDFLTYLELDYKKPLGVFLHL